MSNVSQKSSSPSILEYSNSSSKDHSVINHSRVTQSLQYLDKVSAINKKINDSKKQSTGQSNVLISPLQKLVNSARDITYIDNQKLYGIIKIDILTNLKFRIQQLEKDQQSSKIRQHQLNLKFISVNSQLTNIKNRQIELNYVINQLEQSLNVQKNQRQVAELKSSKLQTVLFQLSSQKIEDSTKIITLTSTINDLQSKLKNQKITQNQHSMISQTQTQLFKSTIQITPFQPKIQQILQNIREKQGQKVSRLTLKQIVTQSLDAFVKELDNQYKVVHSQMIDLNSLRQKNQSLIEENQQLKKTLQQIKIQQEKLKIFKNCMTQFLNETSQNVSKSIEAENIKKRIYETLISQDKLIFTHEISQAQKQNPIQLKATENKQIKQLKQGYQFLKRQNINLLKTLGEYQFKWKNVEKVLGQTNKQEIPDDGTVGQFVKMSKLVKQSIKMLVQEL